MVTEQSSQALRLYGFYKDKVLALSGGILDQPEKYLQAMNVIDLQVKSE